MTLEDKEKEELKGLQDKRKETGGHLTDSERLRLSALMKAADEGKEKEKPPAASTGGTGTFGKK
jgi:hypothetical protein